MPDFVWRLLMLSHVIKECDIFLDMQVFAKQEALEAILKRMCECHGIENLYAESIEALIKREAVNPTIITGGLAIPHARIKTPDILCISFTRLVRPICWAEQDPVCAAQLVFLVIGSENRNLDYLAVLADLSKLMKRQFYKEALTTLNDPCEIFNLICHFKPRKYRCYDD